MGEVSYTGCDEPVALVYDHDDSDAHLAAAAKGLGWSGEGLGDSKDDSDIAKTLAERTSRGKSPQVLLVHLDEDGLEVLVRECGGSVTIVACSTAPHELLSDVPEVGRPLLLRLRRPLNSAFSREVLGNIVSSLDEGGIARLRSGIVPEGLRGQFAFRESLLVHALLILVQGAIDASGVGRGGAVEPAAWWRRGLGLADGATWSDGDHSWRGFISELALELGMEWRDLKRSAPESTKLLQSLRHQGGSTPRDCNWDTVKMELEKLLWPE